MLAWIFAIGLMIWLLYSRFRKNAFIFRLPLGMPEGTVRAYISIILVSFPFMFVWQGSDVPDIISNMLFLVTAFYFEKRSSKYTAKTIVKELENPQQQKRSRLRFGLPMYWPKYSVRTLLIVLIVVLFFTSPPNIIPTITNHDTFANLLITMGSFILGLAGGRVGKNLLTRRLQRLVKKKGISLSEASEKIDPSIKRKALIFENMLSIIVITAVLSSLFLFTFNLSPGINLFGIVPISVRENLLQFISLYFGFRQ